MLSQVATYTSDIDGHTTSTARPYSNATSLNTLQFWLSQLLRLHVDSCKVLHFASLAKSAATLRWYHDVVCTVWLYRSTLLRSAKTAQTTGFPIQVIARPSTICPRRSRRIYVHAKTDLQSAQLWWPACCAPRRCSRCLPIVTFLFERSTPVVNTNFQLNAIPLSVL